MELYGAAVQIPDNAALETAMKYIVDSFLGFKLWNENIIFFIENIKSNAKLHSLWNEIKK